MALGYRVFTEIERPPAALVQAFAGLATPDIADSMQRTGVVSGRIQPVYRPIPRITGPAVTVSVPEGAFNMRKIAMETAQPGDVLVVAGRGNVQYAMLGGNIAKGLKHRGLAGAIIDGAIRDASEMRAVGFPVYACGYATNSGPKAGPGEVNVPVAVGDSVIFPGDIIVADEDGIVAVPPVHAEVILQSVERLKESHARIQPVLERGGVTNIAAIRQELEDTGCEFIRATFSR
jgi:RraA family protein